VAAELRTFTIIEPDGAHDLDAAIGDRVVIAVDEVSRILGWTRKPEGLCQADICIPVRPGSELDQPGGLDLEVLAATLRRPLALDREAGAAFLGASAASRAEQLASLEAPDFTLPDRHGHRHSLSDHRGKKVFLVAWASW
jgi:hypothetical protein